MTVRIQCRRPSSHTKATTAASLPAAEQAPVGAAVALHSLLSPPPGFHSGRARGSNVTPYSAVASVATLGGSATASSSAGSGSADSSMVCDVTGLSSASKASPAAAAQYNASTASSTSAGGAGGGLPVYDSQPAWLASPASPAKDVSGTGGSNQQQESGNSSGGSPPLVSAAVSASSPIRLAQSWPTSATDDTTSASSPGASAEADAAIAAACANIFASSAAALASADAAISATAKAGGASSAASAGRSKKATKGEEAALVLPSSSGSAGSIGSSGSGEVGSLEPYSSEAGSSSTVAAAAKRRRVSGNNSSSALASSSSSSSSSGSAAAPSSTSSPSDALSSLILPAVNAFDEGGRRTLTGATVSQASGSGSTAPSARWGQVAAPLAAADATTTFTSSSNGQNSSSSSSSSFILFGGEDTTAVKGDVWTATLTSSAPSASASVPASAAVAWSQPAGNVVAGGRKWASAVHVASSKVLLVFGGENDDAPVAAGSSSASPAGLADDSADGSDPMGLGCFDTELQLWYSPSVTGRHPQPRSGHSLTLLPSCVTNANASTGSSPVVALFGGIRRRGWLNDVYLLRTDTYRWQHVRPGGQQPPPRCYHAAAAALAPPPSAGSNSGSQLPSYWRLVVFGGNDGNRSFRDVHVLECR